MGFTLKNTYLGELKKGKLKRLPFLSYQLLLFLLIAVFSLAVVLLMGIGEHILGGDLAHAQDVLRAWFTLPFMGVFSVFMLAVCFFFANITAKRIRDIGLAAWTTLAIFLLAEILETVIINQQASSVIHGLFVLFLLLIPSEQFNK